jgi:hypothetical protein
MGEQLLHGPGVAFHELVEPSLILLDQAIDIIQVSHL